MRTSKFSVGERVILSSKEYSQWNNQIFEVLLVLDDNASWTCPWSGINCHSDCPGYGYILDCEDMQDDPTFVGQVCAIAWAETALRKIPPTSEYSFEDMMTMFKDSVLEKYDRILQKEGA